MKTNHVYKEPCLTTLKNMPDEYLDCVITSPPYWQLRDYGYEGQWGLEPTIQEYLKHLWEMMIEIYRVLKPSGTCWINLGDTYEKSTKCLMLIPHRFAIGCIDRGWIMRNDIIWAKRNGMPDSVIDRFTKKHEYFFLMVKSQNYFFDLDAIRDKIKTEIIQKKSKGVHSNKYGDILNESEHRQGMHQQRGVGIIEKRPNLPTQEYFVSFMRDRIKMNTLCESIDIPKTTIEHWYRKDQKGFSFPSVEHWNIIKEFLDNWDEEFEMLDARMTEIVYESDDIMKNADKGKNPSDVSDFWDIPTKPSKMEHFASYNDKLIMKPILAGCPENGLVYDPFMGTGSTAHACLRANRNFIGSEMSESYVKICNKRIEPLLKQQILF